MLLNIGSIHRVDDVPDTNVAIDGLSSLGSAGYADGDTGRSKRISELTNARTLTGPEQIPIVQAGVTHKTTLLNLLANTGAFDLTVPTGNEPLLTIEDGVTAHITLGQLFTLFMQWNDYIATNPLSAASGSGNNGLEIKLQAGDGDGSGTGGNISLQPGLGGDATPGSVEIPSPDGTYAGQLTVETDPYSMAKSLLITTSDIPAFGVQLYVHSGRPDQQNVNIPGSAWFESGNVVADGVDGADAGLGSGVTTTGQSGVGWLYSGNTNGGNSGVVQIVSGNVQSGSGNSGDINIASGSVVDGTRGNIVLDAPNVQTANQTGATASSALSLATGTTVDGASGGVFVFSGDTSGNGTTGNAWLYSGNTNAGTANTGDTNILTGDSFGGASGNIHLTTGAAAATRGNIILDTPLIASPIGSILHLTSLGTTGGPARSGDAGIESGDTTAGTGDSGNAFLGSSDAGGRAGSVFVYGGISHGADQQGGSLVISSGAAVTGNANGGDILIQTAAGVGTGRQGNITLDTGGYNSSGWISINASINTVLGQPLELGTLPNSTNDSDAADLYTGSASGVHSSGEASIGSGNATGTGNTGDAALYTGDAAAGSTGIAGVSSGVAGNGNSGAVVLVTGNATGGNSGNVSLITGTSSGGLRGKIFLDTDIISLPNTVQTTIHGTGITYLQGDQDTWLFSSDATGSNDSYTVGVGSGQADAGTSSYALLYTGNVNTGVSSGPVQLESGDIASGTGRSGNIELLTGQSPGGTSGDITLTTNANATTRGSIILNARITTPTGSGAASGTLTMYTGPATGGGTGDIDIGSHDATSTYTSGFAALGSGNTVLATTGTGALYSGDSSSGASGEIDILSGYAGGGNSGGIRLTTGATYEASAVHFDNSTPGSVFLLCDSLSCTDNSTVSFSGWVNLATNPGGNNVFVSDPVGEYLTYFQLSSTFHGTPYLGAVDVSMGHAGGGSNFEIGTEYTAVAFNQWVHILWSLDSSTGTSALYINDVLTSTTNENLVGLPFNSDMNGKPFYVGDDTFGTTFIGDMADIWIAPGVSLLDGGGLIPEATRRQFISATLQPVNPSGFPSSAVLLSGDHTAFTTNQGTGGSFSLTGGLTNASTIPTQSVQSGDITLAVGNARVPGNIVLDGQVLLNTTEVSTTTGLGFFQLQTGNETAASTPSADLYIVTGGSADGDTGSANLGTSQAQSASGNSGSVYISSGPSDHGNSGDIQIYTSTAGGTRGNIVLDAPLITSFSDINMVPPPGNNVYIASATNSSGDSGSAGIESGGAPSGTSGVAFLGTSDANKAGDVAIYGGTSHGASQQGGSINIYSGAAAGTTAPAGDIVFHPSNGTSRSGLIIFNDLPTASPGVSGAVWRDTGTSPHTLRIDP